MTSGGQPGTEAVERKAGVAADSVYDITVGAVSDRRRKLDTVPALIDGLTTLALEAANLSTRSPLEAGRTMAGAGAWVICRMALGGGVMTATNPT